MSLDEINRELEELLSRIKRVKLEERNLGKKEGESLSDILEEIEKLRMRAQDPNDEIAKRNKTQDVRTFENFEAVYKAVKLRADSLRDAGKMRHAINSEQSIETRTMEAYERFHANIEPKKLAMLEEFKNKYSETELRRVKQEVADTYAAKITDNEREMKQGNAFLKEISKDEISRFKRSSDILIAIQNMEQAKKEMEQARQIIEEEMQSATREAREVNTDTINEQGQIIAEAKTKIAAAQVILGKYGILEADTIITADGEVNLDKVTTISDAYKQNAIREKRRTGRKILDNIERYRDKHSDTLEGEDTLKLYLYDGNKKIPDDIRKSSPREIERIVKSLLDLGNDLDIKERENHVYRQKIDEIQNFLKTQSKESSNGSKAQASTAMTKSGNYRLKTSKEYRDAGVTLDETYALKGFWQQRQMREEYIMSTLPPDMPFRKFVAWFRSFSPRAGYALSEAKREREMQYRRKEEVFQAAMKQIGMTKEEARIQGMMDVRIDKLSGKRKAQMEERE